VFSFSIIPACPSYEKTLILLCFQKYRYLTSSLSAQQNAKDILNNQFGPGNWNKGPGSDFNKIVKWINRSGLFVWSLGNTDRLQADENGDYFIFLYSEGIMS
jgi:hypothetical protein